MPRTYPGEERPDARRKRPWSAPALEELPPLNELTLQSGDPIPGGGGPGGGGSTVF
jgi:hypothetical protein